MTAELEPHTGQDPVGAATLERLALAPRYNTWMFERIRPWVGDRVLEIGAGIGNLSAFLVDRSRVTLTDTSPTYLEALRTRFAGRPNVKVGRLFLPTVDANAFDPPYDTVICLNVLEHVEDDARSLSAILTLLRPGGRLVLLVPALSSLYGTLDRALGHYRRYGKRDLEARMTGAGFRMEHTEYFNLGGIPGWWLTGRVLRRQLIPQGSLKLYDALVPLFRLERFLPWRVGQSLIAVGVRP
ncbi:MAG TPA: class I SAM-dependent methyltransferase [Gemmatimonadales bacterium]|nr:class I SAM-dependent methyltransferase [Gemmatimonadales bacterium]